MITQNGIKKASASIFSLFKGIRITFGDDSIKDLPIYEGSTTEEQVKILGLVSDDVTGRIVKIQLMDTEDEVFAEKECEIEKDEAEGLLVSFVLRLYETEAIA